MDFDTKKVVIRPITQDDKDHLLEIDRALSGEERKSYIDAKAFWATELKEQLFTSFVAEIEGRVIGFIMGEVYLGAFGIPEDTATIDTIGVHPDFQKHGVANMLLDEYKSHAKAAGIKHLHTLVAWNEWKLIHFFDAVGFSPAKTLSLSMDLD